MRNVIGQIKLEGYVRLKDKASKRLASVKYNEEAGFRVTSTDETRIATNFSLERACAEAGIRGVADFSGCLTVHSIEDYGAPESRKASIRFLGMEKFLCIQGYLNEKRKFVKFGKKGTGNSPVAAICSVLGAAILKPKDAAANDTKNDNAAQPVKIKSGNGQSDESFESEEPNFPEELNSHEYIEGATKNISVNAYERNKKARKECVAHYGYNCTACGFDFEKTYGDIGKDFIHVHHIVPLNEIKNEYKVNPIEDLKPVCPNCHAMLHRQKNRVLTIEELEEMMVNAAKQG